MIDILVRAMRKIVNEEVKMKSIAFVSQHNQSNSLEPTSIRGSVNIGANGTAASSANTHQKHLEEYYQGGCSGSVDTYKEIVTFYMNTIIKRKMHKYRHIFEETLLTLFL